MYVSTILKNKGDGVVTALGDVKVSEIVQILRDKRIGAVVISDDGATVAGILSDTSLPDPSEVPPLPPNPIFDQELARRLQAICVKTPLYGTVSSTNAAVKPGEVVEYQYAAAPPGDSGFEDIVDLIRS